jgi:UDP-N-acetylmuramoyl-tripeptide--D-alanyl-D-alanine ligase
VLSRTWAARRVAVIGEMLELGDLSLPLHQDCGRAAAASRLSRLITIGGPSALAVGEAAIGAGLAASAVSHFDTSAAAAAAIAGLVASGDVVLVKGSRGTRTEVVVEQLMTVFG